MLEMLTMWNVWQAKESKGQVEIVQEVTKVGLPKPTELTPCVLDAGMDLQDLMFASVDFCLILVWLGLAILVLLPLGMEMFTWCHPFY